MTTLRTHMKIGYARVSTSDQLMDPQINILNKIGCEKIFAEHASGKTSATRSSLMDMINFARDGDSIYVTKVDRLARNTIDALKISDQLMEKNVGLVFLDLGGVDINSDVGRVIYTTISAFAEMERKRILQRCNEGRAIARDKNKHLGRRADLELHKNIKQHYKRGMNKNLISKTLNCSRTTVYRVLSIN